MKQRPGVLFWWMTASSPYYFLTNPCQAARSPTASARTVFDIQQRRCLTAFVEQRYVRSFDPGKSSSNDNYCPTVARTPSFVANLPRKRCYRETFQIRYAHNDGGNMNNEQTNVEGMSSKDNDRIVIEKTRSWLKRTVIGMNLCPFADMKTIKFDVIPESMNTEEEEEILIAKILEALIERSQVPGTTLVICPNCCPNDFEGYLYVLDIVHRLIKDYDLEGIIQVAEFHPLFLFGGSIDFSVDDEGDDQDSDSSVSADNWTNRSPYPIVHIIREDDVTNAVERLKDGDAGKIWRRNVDLLDAIHKELGKDLFVNYFRGDEKTVKDSTVRSRIREILREFPTNLND